MPITIAQWAIFLLLVWCFAGVGIVSSHFKASPLERPAYAAKTGPHNIFWIFYIPIRQLVAPIGGVSFRSASVFTLLYGLIVSAILFFVLGLFLQNWYVKTAIVSGIYLFLAMPLLLPGRNQ